MTNSPKNQAARADAMLADVIVDAADSIDLATLPSPALGKISEVAEALHVAAEMEVARRVAANLLEHARLAGCAETSPAAKLRWVAEGRRQYLHGMPDETRPRLELEVAALETAARIVDGDLEPLYGLLPTWLWTEEMHAELGVGRG
jgi:hypothetical protein